MSVNIDDLKDVLWESLDKFLGVPMMFADQKVKIPESGMYGTLKLISGPIMQGHDSHKVDGDKHVVSGQRAFTLSVNLYREGAVQLMSNLQQVLQMPSFIFGMKKVAANKNIDLAIVDALAVQNLTSLVQSDYEERAQMDVRLRAVSSLSEDLEPIERVVAQGEIKHADGDDPDKIILDIDVQ